MLVLFSFLCLLSWASSVNYILQTSSGTIAGILNHYGTQNVFEFRNIPYAKPPVGDLRFRKPQPYGSWTGLRDGSHFGPSCMQDTSFFPFFRLENKNISEDCLSLNIYIPYQMPIAGKHNRSVMIWVHGGGYVLGQGELYDPSALAVSGDVIVVTINYRLGVFGFLSTEDDASVGNYGLWDQHLAFKWVKENTVALGGNPNSITIFGESAGGWSVALQSLAVQNKGLFQRVIAQSGVSNSMAAVTHEGLQFAKKCGVMIRCINSTVGNIDTADLVSCLRRKSSNELLSVQMSESLRPDNKFHFDYATAPVVDGEFLADHPKIIIEKRNSESFKMFQSIDFMTGNCNNDGSLIIPNLNEKSKTAHFNISVGVPASILCNYVVPGLVHDFNLNNSQSKVVSNAVCHFYKSADLAEQGRKITNLIGDIEFVVPAIESLIAHSNRNTFTKSYQYMFNRPSLLSNYNEYQWFNGSEHAAELVYLFGLNISLPQDEKILSQDMLQYWTNFAKTGNPNGDGLQYWPTFNASGRYYLNLDTTVSSMDHPINDRVVFWTKRIPSIILASDTLPSVIGK